MERREYILSHYFDDEQREYIKKTGILPPFSKVDFEGRILEWKYSEDGILCFRCIPTESNGFSQNWYVYCYPPDYDKLLSKIKRFLRRLLFGWIP